MLFVKDWTDDILDDGMEDESVMPTRVKKIFSAMDSPQRLRILRALNSKGPLSYSDLKKFAGFHPKAESGKYAYHLRSLDNPGLVTLDKNTKRYGITNLGKIALSLAKQIEEKSIHESGRMYVRTSHQVIEEFNADKIMRSLIREGRMPMELAQRITEETENRIYKYQTLHLTGPLIRELVNAVLLEEGHEDYRDKMTRLGVPAHDLQEMLTDTESVKAGLESVILTAGRRVFVEYLLTNALPRDVTDMYLGGNIHISNLATWPLAPDSIFVHINDILDDSARSELSLTPNLTKSLNQISWEASNEIVIDGMADIDTSQYNLNNVLIMRHAPRGAALISLKIPLSAPHIHDILESYKAYTKVTRVPSLGMVLDPTDADIGEFSGALADIIKHNGMITVSKDGTARSGVTNNGTGMSAKLHSLAINLPGLAYESENDEAYFRAKLATIMDPIISALEHRQKSVADMTRRGINPFLAKNFTQNDKKFVGLLVNLVGIDEAVSHVIQEDNSYDNQLKVLDTANNVAARISRKNGLPTSLCMAYGDGAERLVELDAEKYGRDKVLQVEDGRYRHGIGIDVRQTIIPGQIDDTIYHAKHLKDILRGGLYTELSYHKDTPRADIAKGIEALAGHIDFTIRPAKSDLS